MIEWRGQSYKHINRIHINGQRNWFLNMYQKIFKENKPGIVIIILCAVVIAVFYKLVIKHIYDEIISLNIKQLNDQQEKSKPLRNSSYFENHYFFMI